MNKMPLHGNARLTEDDIIAICQRYAQGEKQKVIAQEYGVSQSLISKVVCGVTRLSMETVKPVRYCIDCQASIPVNRKRCDACRATWNKRYFRQWYNRNRKVPTTRRYRIQAKRDTYEDAAIGWNVIDNQSGESCGLYSYNHARYLARKWNKSGVTV